MTTTVRIIVLFFISVTIIVCCDKRKDNEETVLKGKATVMVDETLMPIAEEQIEVFESQYDAKIKLIAKSEAEAVNALLNDSVKIAILSRQLSAAEVSSFTQKKIVPKMTPFAIDAVALIRNKKDNDTLVALSDVLDMLRGKPVASIKGLVFDNPNSSTARYLCELAGVKELPEGAIYSFANNEDAIRHISENAGMIGIVGLGAISQPYPEIESLLEKISVLAVRGVGGQMYYKPTQNNIAEGSYPLARHLFVVNCQGYQGLGIGLASFAAGERGQRIILKSGLMPVRLPGRKVVIRTQIEKNISN